MSFSHHCRNREKTNESFARLRQTTSPCETGKRKGSEEMFVELFDRLLITSLHRTEKKGTEESHSMNEVKERQENRLKAPLLDVLLHLSSSMITHFISILLDRTNLLVRIGILSS